MAKTQEGLTQTWARERSSSLWPPHFASSELFCEVPALYVPAALLRTCNVGCGLIRFFRFSACSTWNCHRILDAVSSLIALRVCISGFLTYIPDCAAAKAFLATVDSPRFVSALVDPVLLTSFQVQSWLPILVLGIVDCQNRLPAICSGGSRQSRLRQGT